MPHTYIHTPSLMGPDNVLEWVNVVIAMRTAHYTHWTCSLCSLTLCHILPSNLPPTLQNAWSYSQVYVTSAWSRKRCPIHCEPFKLGLKSIPSWRPSYSSRKELCLYLAMYSNPDHSLECIVCCNRPVVAVCGQTHWPLSKAARTCCSVGLEWAFLGRWCIVSI